MVEVGKVLGEVSSSLLAVFCFCFVGCYACTRLSVDGWLTDRGQLLRRYNWALADPLNPPKIRNNGVWVIRDFYVTVEKR
ncbi:hypothetical protein B0I37DRAFT_375833 [Chaetomium sp. MPI-CAGE-AT-0009]|nr:hypothetical protein B0I37DRAFT_375833 [Chaetomium sp. MPI-CAGE-AT-0009]